MKYLNNIRLKNYRYLIKNLKKYKEFLVHQTITNDTYFPYTAAFRIVSKNRKLRTSLLKFFKKRKIPIIDGFHRLVSEHPIFEKQIAYGKFHCPYSCHLYNKKYVIDDLDIAKKLNNAEYIAFSQIGWPTKTSDMKRIIATFDDFFRKTKI